MLSYVRVSDLSGYGGFGYGRRALNDLFCLDTSTMEWEEVAFVRGDPPEPRSGTFNGNVRALLIVCLFALQFVALSWPFELRLRCSLDSAIDGWKYGWMDGWMGAH